MIRQIIAALLAAASWAPAAQAQDTRQDGGQYGGRRMDRGDRQGNRPERQQQAQPQQAQPQQAQPQQVQQPQAPAVAQPAQQRGDWRQRGQAQQRFGGQAQGQLQGQPQEQFQGQFQGQQRGGDRRFDGRSQFQPQQDQARGDRQGRDRAGIDARAQGDRRPDFQGNRADGYDRGRYGYGNANRGGDARGYAAGGNRTDWNRGWRGDGRYDWNRYRQSNRSAFRLPRYYAPSNWSYGYRRFGIGVTLSSLLWGQNYWIEEPDFYRLPPAYGPYRWVRYYNDALLVDIRSGYVVDTVYDIFW